MFLYARRAELPANHPHHGAVWRFHGNTGRHMSREALEFDQALGRLVAKPVQVLDITEAQFAALARNTLNTATGKAIL